MEWETLGCKSAGMTASSWSRSLWQALSQSLQPYSTREGCSCTVLSQHTGAHPVLSPVFGHIHLPSGKTSFYHKPQRHFLGDLMKDQFQSTAVTALVFKISPCSCLQAAFPYRGGPGCICWGRRGEGLVHPPPIPHCAGENKSSAPRKHWLNGAKQPHLLGVNGE